MPVVINEFEVIPQAGQPAPTQQQENASATASIPANVMREIERIAHKKTERQHRLSTY